MKLINVFLKKEISLLKKERERKKVKILFKHFMCNNIYRYFVTIN